MTLRNILTDIHKILFAAICDVLDGLSIISGNAWLWRQSQRCIRRYNEVYGKDSEYERRR